MGKRSLQHQCWFPESQGGDQVQGEDPQSEEEEVEGVGHHQGVGDLPHEEDLLEEGEDHHPLEGGPLPEGGLPLQGGEAGLEEDQELLQGAPEDLPQGILVSNSVNLFLNNLSFRSPRGRSRSPARRRRHSSSSSSDSSR